jgi:hypothetical protein
VVFELGRGCVEVPTETRVFSTILTSFRRNAFSGGRPMPGAVNATLGHLKLRTFAAIVETTITISSEMGSD